MSEGEVFARRGRILGEIDRERSAQLGEYDDSHHTAETWIARLAKHVGRAVTTDPQVFRHAMVVVGALAVAAIEWVDEHHG